MTLGCMNPVPCNHSSPTFGCPSCIQAQHDGWATARYEAWRKTYKFPKCAACGQPTTVYGWDYEKGKLVAVITCTRDNIACMDEDFYQDIP